MGYQTLVGKQSDYQLGYVHWLSTSWTKTTSARTARDLHWWSDGDSNRFWHWQSSHEVRTDFRVEIRVIFGRGQKFRMPVVTVILVFLMTSLVSILSYFYFSQAVGNKKMRHEFGEDVHCFPTTSYVPE